MKIRSADKSDIIDILPLCAAMHQESQTYRGIPYDHGVMAAFLEIAIENPQSRAVLVSEDAHGNIAGFMIGLIAPFFFSKDESYSCDLLLYVNPSDRGGMHAVALVDAYESWAECMGVKKDYIRLGVSTGYAKAEEFYQRLGYTKIGTLYQREA